MKKPKTKKPAAPALRSPLAAILLRERGIGRIIMSDRRRERGGAKNRQAEYRREAE